MAGQIGRPKKQPDLDELDRAQGHDPSWMAWARCRALPPATADALFFPVDKNDHLARERREYCGACPVQVECLTYGNIVHPDYGAYGGFSAQERRTMMRYKGQRPPKDAHNTEHK